MPSFAPDAVAALLLLFACAAIRLESSSIRRVRYPDICGGERDAKIVGLYL